MAEEYEKKTPLFDWETGEFKKDLQGRVVTATEVDAVVEIVMKAQQTLRGVYLIYANYDEDLNHKYGNDAENVLRAPGLSEAARISELKRAIEESLIYDPWITAIDDIDIKRRKDLTGKEPYLPAAGDHSKTDEVYASCTVHHIFGTSRVEGVLLNG